MPSFFYERGRIFCRGSKLVKSARSAMVNVRSQATTEDGQFDQLLLELRVLLKRKVVCRTVDLFVESSVDVEGCVKYSCFYSQCQADFMTGQPSKIALETDRIILEDTRFKNIKAQLLLGDD